jgi:hypothetical protein
MIDDGAPPAREMQRIFAQWLAADPNAAAYRDWLATAPAGYTKKLELGFTDAEGYVQLLEIDVEDENRNEEGDENA